MRITVLDGGPSAEREVSLASGGAVAEALRRRGHDVLELDATESAVRALTRADQDVVFIALHGPFGEDGTVQRILEEADIAYTGSDSTASHNAMDKVIAKRCLETAGVFTPPAAVVRRNEASGKSGDSIGNVAQPPSAGAPSTPEGGCATGSLGILSPDFPDFLGLPVVVKPACQGSSLGITIVRTADGLGPALEAAFEYGDAVLVERYVAGRELTVGFLGTEALPVIELRPHREFYDYSAKYVGQQTEYIFETGLAPNTAEAVKGMARRAFTALACRDFGRVDLILDEWQRPFVLEVNTIPGFTNHSLLPKAAARAGIPFEDLCERIVALAWRRGGEPCEAA